MTSSARQAWLVDVWDVYDVSWSLPTARIVEHAIVAFPLVRAPDVAGPHGRQVGGDMLGGVRAARLGADRVEAAAAGMAAAMGGELVPREDGALELRCPPFRRVVLETDRAILERTIALVGEMRAKYDPRSRGRVLGPVVDESMPGGVPP